MTEFRFFHPIEIRYGDLDPQGHVNNAKYLTYFEQARIAYIQHLGLWGAGAPGSGELASEAVEAGDALHAHHSFDDIGIILADVHVTFRAPVWFKQKVQVGARVSHLGNKSMTMEHVLEDLNDGRELAVASSVLVAYDYHNHITIPVPPLWRDVVTAFEGL
jgi:acyl-CoA thioester hydrolase